MQELSETEWDSAVQRALSREHRAYFRKKLNRLRGLVEE